MSVKLPLVLGAAASVAEGPQATIKPTHNTLCQNTLEASSHQKRGMQVVHDRTDPFQSAQLQTMGGHHHQRKITLQPRETLVSALHGIETQGRSRKSAQNRHVTSGQTGVTETFPSHFLCQPMRKHEGLTAPHHTTHHDRWTETTVARAVKRESYVERVQINL